MEEFVRLVVEDVTACFPQRVCALIIVHDVTTEFDFPRQHKGIKVTWSPINRLFSSIARGMFFRWARLGSALSDEGVVIRYFSLRQPRVV